MSRDRKKAGRSSGDSKLGRVGIFWWHRGRLFCHSTPISTAEPYGDTVGDPMSHMDYWRQLQLTGQVRPEIEYDEPPRGRVVYNSTTQSFLLLADRCILGRAVIIEQIMRELRLPKITKMESDAHYRCGHCLYSDDHDEAE